MKDSVVRGCLLQFLYERRSEGSIPFGRLEQAVHPPGGISHRDWLRAVAQLSEYGSGKTITKPNGWPNKVAGPADLCLVNLMPERS